LCLRNYVLTDLKRLNEFPNLLGEAIEFRLEDLLFRKCYLVSRLMSEKHFELQRILILRKFKYLLIDGCSESGSESHPSCEK